MKGRILIAGIGNIFLGDDAFGVELVKRMRQRPLPQNVSLIDFGVRSYDLAYALMQDWDLVILVDAICRGAEPGTLFTIRPEHHQDGTAIIDAHAMNPVAALRLVKTLGGRIAPLLVVGCQPATLEPNPDGNFVLSTPVNAAVDPAIAMVEQLISRARTAPSAA
ncbi:MAG TPA: hydrogenase maturation protease [Candidatus Acidoferrales bacterium]|nr:hydrogenase maturation protease [Candidatus Acidoferrales bacterium]